MLGSHHAAGSVQEEEQGQRLRRSKMSNTSNGSELLSFRASSLLLGIICGAFVQFSSLAANYYVWMLRQHHQHPEWAGVAMANNDEAQGVEVTQGVLLMNLCWSLFTTSIAFSVLAVLRMMIDQNDELQIQLESYFTFGALGGLCSSWMLTDAALGIDTDVRTNVLVLVVASVCCKLLMSIFVPRHGARDLVGMTERLLSPKAEAEAEHSADDRNEPNLRWTASQCGLLIGLFIQLSGLGANSFLLREAHATEQQRLTLSVGWSFVTSCLGILALFFVRQIILTGSRGMSASLLVAIECFFASGATVGLNAAWTITDVVLGLKPHFFGSVIATLVTFGWCKLILLCTDDAFDDQELVEQEEEEEGAMTHTRTLNDRRRDEGQSLLAANAV